MTEQAVVAATHPEFTSYWVLRDGSVISMLHNPPRKLSPIRMGDYRGLQLRDRLGVRRKVYVHRFVAETFHGAPIAGQEVRHMDGNRLNNSADNLCWGTRAENMRDKERHGTAPQGSKHGGAKLTEAKVVELRKMRARGASLEELAVEFGVSRMACWRAATGRLWSHVKEN